MKINCINIRENTRNGESVVDIEFYLALCSRTKYYSKTNKQI